MTVALEYLTSALFGGGLGAIIGCMVQYYLTRKSKRIDELRTMLVNYAHVVSKYWNSNCPTRAERASLEAEIKVNQILLFGEFNAIARKYRSVKRVKTEKYPVMITDLRVRATGGLFESRDWKPEPWRAQAVTRTVTAVLTKLP